MARLMAPFIFTCPNTNMSVQHSFDDDNENGPDTEYGAITCPACTGVLAWVDHAQPKEPKPH